MGAALLAPVAGAIEGSFGSTAERDAAYDFLCNKASSPCARPVLHWAFADWSSGLAYPNGSMDTRGKRTFGENESRYTSSPNRSSQSLARAGSDAFRGFSSIAAATSARCSCMPLLNTGESPFARPGIAVWAIQRSHPAIDASATSNLDF